MKSSLTVLIFFFFIVSANAIFCQEKPSDKEKLIELAWQQFNDGVAIIEKAETMEDFKRAITAFNDANHFALAAGLFTELGGTISYNLGLLYDAIEDYNMAGLSLTMYICSKPAPDDSAEVKAMIDQIDYKAGQFINPAALTGIWCYSWPKEQCEPRLEIRVENGIVKARALYSEGTEINNQLNVPHDPGQYIAMGSFVPIKWDYNEAKLTVLDAPYFTCAKGFEADMCPSPVTFYLKRTGVNRLEGNVIFNEKYYQDYNKPDWIQHNFSAVYERVSE